MGRRHAIVLSERHQNKGTKSEKTTTGPSNENVQHENITLQVHHQSHFLVHHQPLLGGRIIRGGVWTSITLVTMEGSGLWREVCTRLEVFVPSTSRFLLITASEAPSNNDEGIAGQKYANNDNESNDDGIRLSTLIVQR